MARSARGVVNAYTLGGQHGLWRQAERVLAPTLLVYGGKDQLVGYRMARRAARAFRDSRLLTLPDAGHVAMMEYPETVARGSPNSSVGQGSRAVRGGWPEVPPGEAPGRRQGRGRTDGRGSGGVVASAGGSVSGGSRAVARDEGTVVGDGDVVTESAGG